MIGKSRFIRTFALYKPHEAYGVAQTLRVKKGVVFFSGH